MNSLGIAIDGGRYVRIDSKVGDFSRQVRLRTVEASQTSAVIQFCRFNRSGIRIIKEHRIENLKPNLEEPTEFRLNLERRSFAVWEVQIVSPGDQSDTLVLRTGVGIWPLLIPALLVLGLLLWFLSSTWDSVSGMTETVTSSSDQLEVDSMPKDNASPGERETAISKNNDDSESSEGTEPLQLSLPKPLTVYFQPDSAELSGNARSELQVFAMDLLPGSQIVIEGHVAPFGSEGGRKALSKMRADAVAAYILSLRPEFTELESRGYGADRPATRNPDRQDLNRRVVVSIKDSE